MDGALGLSDYLPISFKTSSEQEYISFLWETFEGNYESGKYQFAFLAYHMLMMSFVYFSLWQIRQTQPDDFAKALIGFPREEIALVTATSPFSFSAVRERAVLRFLKLIACDNNQIGDYSKLVDDRNHAAHPNGNIFFKTQAELDIQIRRILGAVEEIQTYSRLMIGCVYAEFLLQSQNPEEREYSDSEDQIREVLIHGNYMSRKDIEICFNYDVSCLALSHDERRAVEELHSALRKVYGPYIE